ncbi:MAG: hypothetical protein HOY71_25120 [Nonomuraea sp.]|nr:hypothetical protein [Nonomuraea sp.]
MTCHDHGEDCWFADIDDLGCGGRFAAYVIEELTPFGRALFVRQPAS